MVITNREKLWLQVSVFVTVVVIAAFIYVYLIWIRQDQKDQVALRESVNTEILELEEELVEIDRMIANKDEIEKKREVLKIAQKRLPSDPDAPGFLRALVDILQATRIVNQIVKPSKVNAYVLYTEIPWLVECSGRYFEFGPFLALVEQNVDRFMRVKSFTINNDYDRPSIHPIELTIATFMFNPR